MSDMARCLNCLHYDVCDSDRHEKERIYGDCSDFLGDAEVVPREEVDRLRSVLDSYAIQYGTVKSQQKVIDRVKRETAMEIIATIEEERERWEAVYSNDHFRRDGGAYGYLETDVDHTIYTLREKYKKGDNNG